MNKTLVETIVVTLMQGGIMQKRVTHTQKQVYRTYNSRGIITGQFTAASVDACLRSLPHKILKKEKGGNLVLMRRRIQQLPTFFSKKFTGNN